MLVCVEGGIAKVLAFVPCVENADYGGIVWGGGFHFAPQNPGGGQAMVIANMLRNALVQGIRYTCVL